MNLRSSWVNETGQTREDTRLNQVGATTPTNPVQVRSGILPGSYNGQHRLSGFWMTGASAMSATVSEGRAVIQGDISQGVYPVALPAAETVTFGPGDAQYNRVDLVVLKVYDPLYDGPGRNEAVVEVLVGKAEATPKAPGVPPRSLPLYEVTVPAGASAGNGGINWNTALKDLRSPVVSLGGILPVEGPVVPGAYPGQFQDSGGALQRWDGGAWVSYPSSLGGIVPNSAGTLTASYTGQYRDSAGGVLQRWNGSAWRSAVPGPYFTGTNDAGWTASTTYTPTLSETTDTPLQVSFVAPASGAVVVNYGARINSAATTPAWMALRITQGTTAWYTENDEIAVVHTSATASSMASVTRFYGMTPGLTYTMTAMFKVGANTTAVKGNFDNIFIMVTPQN
ncbi:hypothetical protein ACF09C_32075 [Streptomyces sp. NPDC014870]|uniref:hypothetical protein n=1 Tax=Streptomyces sp. NPDC014870 TaxID=3364925 RepID=UPI0036F9F134